MERMADKLASSTAQVAALTAKKAAQQQLVDSHQAQQQVANNTLQEWKDSNCAVWSIIVN